jgi:3'-phosphoadenosine 5'-phosphosulfate sulfotransferase (PAPS reductase)/FAD synthetase
MDTIAVWFSCGAASAVAAKKTIEIYGNTHRVRVINNPIAEEHGDNKRFLRDVRDWLGVEIEFAINPKFPNHSVVEVWEKSQAMSFPWGAPCTVKLKKQARQYWEKENECHAMVLGFTVEEQGRHDGLSKSEILPVIPVLIDLGLSKKDCFDVLHRAGISLPEIYRLGFPNANCVGCCKASSPEYWNLVRRRFPEVFRERADQSRALDVRLVELKGERIFLDELHPEQRSRKIKPIPAYQCSLFCE